MKNKQHCRGWKTTLSFPLVACFAISSCANNMENSGRPNRHENRPEELSADYSSRQEEGKAREAEASALSKGPNNPIRRKELYPGTGKFLGTPHKSRKYIRMTDQDIVLNFENADLREVVEVILGETLGINYIFDPLVIGTVSLKTTGPLPADAVLEILETMLRMNGAAMVIEKNLYKIIPLTTAVKGSLIPEIAEGGQKIPAGYSVLLVPLHYISVLQMDKLLEPFMSPDSVMRVDVDRNILVLAAPGYELSRLLETVALFDVDWLKGKSVGMFRLSYVDAEVVAEELSTIFSNGAEGPLEGILRFVPISRLNALLVLTTQPGYLEKAETWITRLDKGNETGQNLYVHYLQNGKAADVAAILTDLFSERVRPGGRQLGQVAPGLEPVTLVASPGSPPTQNQRNDAIPRRVGQMAAAQRTGKKSGSLASGGRGAKGIAISSNAEIRIVADEVNNALLIRASEKDFRMIKSALRKLDIVPLQVLIEATIAEVTLTDDMRFGLQWFFNAGGLGNGYTGTVRLANGADGSLAPSFPGFAGVINDGSGGIRGILDALEGVTSVNVISSPHLMVLNNHTAELKVGDEVPVITQQQQDTSSVTSTLVNTVQFRDTGVILKVTPRVSSDGTINMEIEQEVSNVVNLIDSGALTPTISQRMVKSSIVAQSDETIVLGGLISDQETKTRSGVPFLSRIPVLGYLFSRSEISKVRTELLVLISPKIVRNATEARRVTQELRERLRGIKNLDGRINSIRSEADEVEN